MTKNANCDNDSTSLSKEASLGDIPGGLETSGDSIVAGTILASVRKSCTEVLIYLNKDEIRVPDLRTTQRNHLIVWGDKTFKCR